MASTGATATRAVIYTRVSKDVTGRQRSVGEQLAECQAVCARNDWTVVSELTDNDRSASRFTKKSRPAYAELLALITEGSLDVVVLWEASRSSRDLETFLPLRALLRETGTRLSYAGRELDLDDVDDAFSATLDALLAERESGTTRKRVMRSVKANAEAGRAHGRLLYGYRRTYDQTGRSEQVPDETTAPLVCEIYERFAAGESRRAIMADLNHRNIPTPTGKPTWCDVTQLTRILTNPGYAGLRVHQGKVIGKAAWQSLVPDLLWKRVQRQLAAKKRDDVRPGARRHHLTGIIECGVCHQPMNLLKTSVRRGAGRAYNCPSFHVARKQEPVDAFVNAVIIERLSRPDAMDVVLNGANDVQLGALLAEREALEVRFNELVEQAASGAISSTMLGAVEKKLNEQMKVLDSQIRTWSGVPTVLADVIGAGAKQKWDELHPTQQNDIARALFSSIRIMPAGKGKRIFDPNLVQIIWS